MPESAFWESSVLKSLKPVLEKSTLVRVNEEKIVEVANWMAYEEFAKPDGSMLFDFGNDPNFLLDYTLVVNTLNFAFTDFKTGVKFETDYMGKRWCDSEAMNACLHRARAAGVPFFEGEYLAKITREELAKVFSGTIEMPMLDERVTILRAVGEKLVADYKGKFHNFVRSCAPKLYSNGDGLLERLTKEFPRFEDVSSYKGDQVQIYKLAQLGIWMMHLTLSPRKAWKLEDAHLLTAFADYIVPVGMRVMGIFEYAPELEKQINGLKIVERDSDAEIEIRANSLYCIARLTDEINARRKGLEPLLMPQVDFRLWKSYHATHWPHHLTVTTMY
jgi:hypothetical protein